MTDTGKFALGIAVACLLFACGWLVRDDDFAAYKAEMKALAEQQARQTEELNAKHEQEAKDAEQNTIIAAERIDAYYRAHPVVRVRYTSASCVPEANPNPEGADATPAAGDATAYVSPYAPDATEQVANRLDQLQKLLRADGVEVVD